MTSNVIDTHAHLYPAKYLDFLEEHGASPSTTNIARNLRASDEEEMSARLRQMDEAGVEVQVLSVTPQAPMLEDPAAALEASHMVNDIHIDTIEKYPGRFQAYLALPVPHIEESLTILDEYFETPGFVGVTLPTFILGSMSIADPALDELYERLNELKARVYVPPTGGGAQSPAINDFSLEWVNGAPMEDVIATLQLLKADIPHRFPNIRFHIAHLGGDLAFLSQRIEDNYADWGSFTHSPQEALKKMWFDAANFHGISLLITSMTFTPENLMMGSEYPYFQDDKYTRAVEYIKDAGLTDAQVEGVLRENALNFYEQ